MAQVMATPAGQSHDIQAGYPELIHCFTDIEDRYDRHHGRKHHQCEGPEEKRGRNQRQGPQDYCRDHPRRLGVDTEKTCPYPVAFHGWGGYLDSDCLRFEDCEIEENKEENKGCI